MLKPGEQAPGFNLPDADMKLVGLDQFRGTKNLVLYFYPKDDTPGCTTEAIEFTDRIDEFQRHDTVVVGVSRDACASHAAFRDKHGLAVQLLADVDGEASETYGVWQERERNGVTKPGIVRSTFVIDKAGVVRHALYGVTAKGHAQQVLELVRALDGD